MKLTRLFYLPLAVLLGIAGLHAQQPPAGKRNERDLREEGKLKPGDKAPDFTLKSLDGKKSVTLSSFQAKKPVALIFGSYT